MELGGSPHALRMSLIDVAAYPRVAISRSVASRISSRDCSPCCCFFVGHIICRDHYRQTSNVSDVSQCGFRGLFRSEFTLAEAVAR